MMPSEGRAMRKCLALVSLVTFSWIGGLGQDARHWGPGAGRRASRASARVWGNPPVMPTSPRDLTLHYRTWESPLVPLSIGEDCKTHFPYRHRFFDPGVCSRSSWAVSS